MPGIPLGLKAYRRLANFQPEVELVNLIIEKDESGGTPSGVVRIMRPGLALDESNGSGIGRDIYRQSGFFSGDRFKVAGTTLYRGSTALGTIGGDGQTPWAAGVGYLFVLGGSTLYWTDGSTMGVVALPDDAEGVPIDIDALNSYVFVGCDDGTVYWIVPGENEIDPLNFITAESAPDGLRAVRRLESEIFLFGASSVEPWQLTGDQDAVIQKAIGRQYERGCLDRDAVRRFDNSLMWVGENGNVYRAGAQPEVVADEGISERIRKRTGSVSAMVFGFDRHEMYALRIPGQGTFCLDASTREWNRLKTAGNVLWAPHACTYDETGVYLISEDSQKIWALSPDSAFDEDIAIEWTVTGNAAVMGNPKRNDSFAVVVGCSSDATLRLRWRDADEDFPSYYEEIVARAPADAPTFYRLGSISPPYRSFELSGDDGVRVRIGDAATEAWQ